MAVKDANLKRIYQTLVPRPSEFVLQFGTGTALHGSDSSKQSENLKLKARAERFVNRLCNGLSGKGRGQRKQMVAEIPRQPALVTEIPRQPKLVAELPRQPASSWLGWCNVM
ncbi:hypothetical protein Fot_13313 [Forsythia ovata]|uniref:Uncharacterized protein n=1 Tax=Forsythia ovata TaxID=205694 RepID=A0ABD1W334_9LAMI